MKTISFPTSAIQILTMEGEPYKDGPLVAPYRWKQFIFERACDPKFGTNLKALMSAVNIRKAAAEASGNELSIEDADYELLLDAVTSPTGGYNPTVMISLVPFCRAIKEAT